MVVRDYRELVAWQLADELKKAVYELVDNSPARNDWKFRDQIKDAAASGPRNLSDAFGFYHHPEAARLARVAVASETETHNHLSDGVDRGHWSPQDATGVQAIANRALAASKGWLKYLSTSEAPGWGPRGRRKK